MKRCKDCKQGELRGKKSQACIHIWCNLWGKQMGLYNKCLYYKPKWYIKLRNWLKGY